MVVPDRVTRLVLSLPVAEASWALSSIVSELPADRPTSSRLVRAMAESLLLATTDEPSLIWAVTAAAPVTASTTTDRPSPVTKPVGLPTASVVASSTRFWVAVLPVADAVSELAPITTLLPVTVPSPPVAAASPTVIAKVVPVVVALTGTSVLVWRVSRAA